jgi:ribulose-phosphate 3-epimerase
MRLKLAPSILSADFARLGDQVRAVEEAGADQIHVDVMDGHFVPNLSMGPVVVKALRKVTRLPLDVHLMITDPERYIEAFSEAGASHISVHVESNGDHERMFSWLERRGVGRGLALNPDTPVERLFPWLSRLDLALVMTVHPGFGGQSFLAENLDKVRAIREHPDGRRLDIEVDGGIDEETLDASREAGASVFVAGSSIFSTPDPARAVRELRRRLKAHETSR